MAIRQSISLTQPNDNWLKAQTESQEYASKSEVINDIIRKERAKQDEMILIQAQLIKAEQSGFIEQDKNDMLEEFKQPVSQNGTK